MTNDRQHELVAFACYVLGLLVPAVIVYFVARLRLRALAAREASVAHPSATRLSPVAAVVRSLRWGFVATLAAAALCFIPGINLLCYSALMLMGSVAFALDVPERFVEPASFVLLLLTFLFFFTAFRLTQLVDRHGGGAINPTDRNA